MDSSVFVRLDLGLDGVEEEGEEREERPSSPRSPRPLGPDPLPSAVKPSPPSSHSLSLSSFSDEAKLKDERVRGGGRGAGPLSRGGEGEERAEESGGGREEEGCLGGEGGVFSAINSHPQ